MAELFIPRPTLDNVVTRQPGAGRAFFVDYVGGNDNNEGTDPNYPLKTIATAIALCVAEKGDYVFVLDSDFWTANDETYPIALNKGRLHLIGVTHGGLPGLGQELKSETNSIFSCSATANQKFIELAGFNMWAPATKACIEVLDAYWSYMHIHHMKFDGCQDGIRLVDPGADLNFTMIEDCLFGNLITRAALYLLPTSGSCTMSRSVIRNNIFMRAGDNAIYIEAAAGFGPVAILDNVFKLKSASGLGAAIHFGVTSDGQSLVIGNRAAQDGAEPGNNPYRDRTTLNLATTEIGWGMNYSGNTLTFPDVS